MFHCTLKLVPVGQPAELPGYPESLSAMAANLLFHCTLKLTPPDQGLPLAEAQIAASLRSYRQLMQHTCNMSHTAATRRQNLGTSVTHGGNLPTHPLVLCELSSVMRAEHPAPTNSWYQPVVLCQARTSVSFLRNM